MDVPEAEGVVGEQDAADAEVLLRPCEVRGVAGLVGVDEDEVERLLSVDRAKPVLRRTEMDSHPSRHPGALERLAGHLGVARLELERVEEPTVPHSPEQGDAAVASQRPDLDGAPRARGPGEHLEVERVEPADLDGRQPRRCAPLANLAEGLVLRLVHGLGPRRERRVSLAEALHRWGSHRASGPRASPAPRTDATPARGRSARPTRTGRQPPSQQARALTQAFRAAARPTPPRRQAARPLAPRRAPRSSAGSPPRTREGRPGGGT